jgi:hypothetical protein
LQREGTHERIVVFAQGQEHVVGVDVRHRHGIPQPQRQEIPQ